MTTITDEPDASPPGSDVLLAEVWTSERGYVAIVRVRKDGNFDSLDPKEGRVDWTQDTRQGAEDELTLDGFERVGGRRPEHQAADTDRVASIIASHESGALAWQPFVDALLPALGAEYRRALSANVREG